MNSLYIATLSYAEEQHHALWQSILNSIAPLADAGWSAQIMSRTQDADLGRSRNALAAEFLASNATHMLCVDSDLSWDPAAIVRLMRNDVDVVAGIYPQRVEGGSFPLRWMPDPTGKGLWAVDPATGKPSADGLIEVEAVPTGFLRLSRACLEKMTAHFGATAGYRDPSVSTGKAVSLFEFEVRDGERYSEDITFCLKWRALGGRVWVDPNMSLNHHGRKVYSGCLGDWLLKRNPEPVPIMRPPEISEEQRQRLNALGDDAIRAVREASRLADMAMGGTA